MQVLLRRENQAVNLEDPLQELVRCEKFSCSLSHRACLRRQTEMKHIPRAKEDRPVHEYCVSGTCPQGAAIAAKHPGVAFARPATKAAPRLDIIRAVEERAQQGDKMPKGYRRGAACKTCGSTGTKHKADCAEAGVVLNVRPLQAQAEDMAKVFARKPSRAASEGNVEAMEVDELVELRNLVDEELGRRRSELLRQLSAVQAAIGEAA